MTVQTLTNRVTGRHTKVRWVTCAENKPVWFWLARVMLLNSGGELCVLGGNRLQVGTSPSLMPRAPADGRRRV